MALIALLSVCVSGCAGADAGKRVHELAAQADATLPQPELYTDPDIDSDVYPGEADNDNNHVFGHPAGAPETRAVTRLVQRYYAALASDDGAAACRMLYASMAESLYQGYGSSDGGPATHAESCARVATRGLRRERAKLRRQAATLRVAAVRVRNRTASVLLGFAGERPRYYLQLTRERGAWTVSRLIASEQPLYVE